MTLSDEALEVVAWSTHGADRSIYANVAMVGMMGFMGEN
jgi:hypothetical protein